MSLVDVDSWLTEYEACNRLSHSILTQITQRDQRQKLSAEYDRLSYSIQVGLKQFETELTLLKDKLDSSDSNRSLTFEEIERRQRQVETLQSQLQQLKRKNTNATRSDRAALLEASASQSTWQSYEGGGGDAPIIDTNDVKMFKRRQTELLEDQDRGLEVLSKTLSRQRDLASQLGQEVEEQNSLLDNLANTMESVDAGVNVETGNIGRINRTDSTWGYWIVITLLFVTIVIIALI